MDPAHVEPLKNHFIERSVNPASQEPVELCAERAHNVNRREFDPHLDEEADVGVVGHGLPSHGFLHLMVDVHPLQTQQSLSLGSYDGNTALQRSFISR